MIKKRKNNIKRISIKGSEYKIIVEKDYNEKGTNGYIDFDKKEIHIDGSVDLKRQKQVLLHEIFHAVFFECSLYQAIPSEVEEILVDVFASTMVEIFF